MRRSRSFLYAIRSLIIDFQSRDLSSAQRVGLDFSNFLRILRHSTSVKVSPRARFHATCVSNRVAWAASEDGIALGTLNKVRAISLKMSDILALFSNWAFPGFRLYESLDLTLRLRGAALFAASLAKRLFGKAAVR